MISNLKSQISNFLSPIRSGTWWEFKTPIFLGIAYLSACAGGVPLESLWPQQLKILIALVPLASFVCVLNDITDQRDDQRAGKANTMAGKSLLFQALWLAACLVSGACAVWFCFEADTQALWIYLANWLVFTLYSVPPVRLKKRGALGVLADASGGQCLPSIWAALLVAPKASFGFLAALGIWAFALGLRSIIFHQAGDIESDRKSGVPTLAVRFGLGRLAWLIRLAIFPFEMFGFAVLLWFSGSPFVLPFLAIYGFFQFALWRWLRVKPVLVIPSAVCRMFFLKYYQLWLPLGMILTLALQYPLALLLLPFHAIFFPDTWRRFFEHFSRIRHNIHFPPDWEKLSRTQP
ncbi:MAG: hypothetical protein RL630_2256 [Verrucomicrobiota bacterium]